MQYPVDAKADYPEISSRLEGAGMANVFDLQATVQHVTTVFERLRSLVFHEAVVHA